MNENESHFEFDFKDNGGKKIFQSQEDLVDFIKVETEFWTFLNTQKLYALPNNPVAYLNDNINSRLNGIRELINSKQLYQDTKTYHNALRERITDCFIEYRMPTSFSLFGEFIKEQIHSNGMVIVAGLCVYLNILQQRNISSNHYVYFEGMNLISSFKLGLNSKVPQLIKRQTSAMQTKVEEGIQDIRATIISSSKKVEDDFAQYRQQTEERLDKILEQQNILINDKLTESANSIGSIKATEATYKEEMKLKSAVTYWTDKKDHHRNFSIIYGFVVLSLAVAGILCAEISISSISRNALDISNLLEPIQIINQIEVTNKLVEVPRLNFTFYPIFISALLIILSIYFWMLRLAVRFALSEHHLSVEAHEKSIMVQTYLALTNEGKLDSTDRDLVLTPLFRPSSDGFVRDDSSPDIMLSALLSKYLNKQ